MNSSEAFQRYAASCNYSYHGYLDIQNEALVYQQDRTISSISLKKVTDLAIRALQDNPTIEGQEALKIFKASLEAKCKGYFANFWYNTSSLHAAIHQIDEALNKQKDVIGGSEEAAFRIRFLSQLPQNLGVAYAPKTQTITRKWLNGESTTVTFKEWEIIKWVSQKVFQCKAVAKATLSEKKWQVYSEIMTGIYKGDALLISNV
jgi:hypothetical protein